MPALEDLEARVASLESRAAETDARIAQIEVGLGAISTQVSRLADVATTQTYSLERIDRSVRQVLEALTKRGP